MLRPCSYNMSYAFMVFLKTWSVIGILSSVHSSRHYKGGPAGSQTPPYQKAGHRAGQRRVSTSCTTVYSTVKAVYSSLPPLPPSSYVFSNSITTLPWRGTTAWHGRMRSLVNISGGRPSYSSGGLRTEQRRLPAQQGRTTYAVWTSLSSPYPFPSPAQRLAGLDHRPTS